jgi:hypothetical protein
MIPSYFVLISFVISSIGNLSYILDTLRGKAQPNRVTWFMWSLITMIAFAGEVRGGVGLASLAVFSECLGPLAVFICSFVNKKAYWKTTSTDLLCGVLALSGLIAWQINKDPDYAIAFSIFADFFASLPTIRKIWTHPETENRLYYVLNFIGNLIGLLCVQQPGFTGYAYLIWLALINVSLYLMTWRKKLQHAS